MADTTTTNLGLTKPEVGASQSTWGTKINANLDILDGTRPIVAGGTGASTVEGARTNLGVGYAFPADYIGAGLDKTPAERAAALEAIADEYKDVGCTVVLPPSNAYALDPVNLPDNTRQFTLAGSRNRETTIIPTSYAAVGTHGTRSTLITAGTATGTSFFSFRDFSIAAPVHGTRSEFNGIYVHPTNELVVDRVSGRWIDGIAIRVDRSFNGKVGFRTFKCGNATDTLPAQFFTGTVDDGMGFGARLFNDLQWTDWSASEEDSLGLWVEHGANFFCNFGTKLHGPSAATRAIYTADGAGNGRTLTMLRMAHADIWAHLTNEWSSPEQVLIADDGGCTAIGVSPIVTIGAPNSPLNCTCIIRIGNSRKHQYHGPGVGAVVGVAMGSSQSRVFACGAPTGIVTLSGATGYRWVREMCSGVSGSTLDLRDFRPRDMAVNKATSDSYILEQFAGSSLTIENPLT